MRNPSKLVVFSKKNSWKNVASFYHRPSWEVRFPISFYRRSCRYSTPGHRKSVLPRLTPHRPCSSPRRTPASRLERVVVPRLGSAIAADDRHGRMQPCPAKKGARPGRMVGFRFFSVDCNTNRGLCSIVGLVPWFYWLGAWGKCQVRLWFVRKLRWNLNQISARGYCLYSHGLAIVSKTKRLWI